MNDVVESIVKVTLLKLATKSSISPADKIWQGFHDIFPFVIELIYNERALATIVLLRVP